MPDTTINRIEPICVDLPLKQLPRRYLAPHWGVNFSSVRSLCKVTLQNGVIGFGEGGVDASAEDIVGRDAAEFLWNDSVGRGLQMALFDAVGRARGLPIHRLLGRKCRDRASLSWWAPSMPGRDWLSECLEAVSLGYRSFKAKARPWFDVEQQCEVLTQALPEDFLIGLDFNGSLRNTRRAAPYLARLDKCPALSVFESPIPEGDLSGNRFLRTQTRIPIVMHHRHPPIAMSLEEELCDGFVIGGGASEIMRYGSVCADAAKPFWLQMAGSGITAAFCLHFLAVLPYARWPSVNLNHLFSERLVRPEILLEDGSAPIPDRPGLGFDIDQAAVERYRIDGPENVPHQPAAHLFALRWPTGGFSYYANARAMQADFEAGFLPAFSTGVYLEELPNDGSREWRDLYRRAGTQGFHLGRLPEGAVFGEQPSPLA